MKRKKYASGYRSDIAGVRLAFMRTQKNTKPNNSRWIERKSLANLTASQCVDLIIKEIVSSCVFIESRKKQFNVISYEKMSIHFLNGKIELSTPKRVESNALRLIIKRLEMYYKGDIIKLS